MKPHFVTLQHLVNMLRTHSPDDPEVQELLRNGATSLRRIQSSLIGHPFIIKASQFDVTQTQDVKDHQAWEKNPRRLRPQKVTHNLSMWRNLHPEVTGRTGLLWSVENPFGIRVEYSRFGRRCCMVRSNGMRCAGYSAIGAPVCPYHINLVKAVPRMNDRFLSTIKNESLRDAYQKHLSDPNRKSIEREIAMMRTMLDALISRVDAQTDLNKIPVEVLIMVSKLSENIAATVERMANMEAKLGMRMTLDQVTNVVYAVIDLVFKTCPNLEQQQLTAIADGVEKLPIMRTTSAETLEANAEFGHDTDISQGTKMSTDQDKYLSDGTIVKEAFTKDEVTQSKEFIQNKFKPARAEHAAAMEQKKAALEKLSTGLGIDLKTLEAKFDEIKDAEPT